MKRILLILLSIATLSSCKSIDSTIDMAISNLSSEKALSYNVNELTIEGKLSGDTIFTSTTCTFEELVSDSLFGFKYFIESNLIHPRFKVPMTTRNYYNGENHFWSLDSEVKKDKITTGQYGNVFPLKPNHIFKNYIDSLVPYLEHSEYLTEELVSAKVKEAVMVFLTTNPELKELLFDFSEPGKIDLEAYMNEHYHYNGDLEHFAYLTGRSLSTFKRDFEKIFHTTPSRWLLQKKLEDAHYLLKQKKLKATDVYIEVGFKDYAHFFVSFKKLFGMSPSMV